MNVCLHGPMSMSRIEKETERKSEYLINYVLFYFPHSVLRPGRIDIICPMHIHIPVQALGRELDLGRRYESKCSSQGNPPTPNHCFRNHSRMGCLFGIVLILEGAQPRRQAVRQGQEGARSVPYLLARPGYLGCLDSPACVRFHWDFLLVASVYDGMVCSKNRQ